MHKAKDIVNDILWIASFTLIICLFCFTSAHAYTNEEYANAIRHAEGTWTYGIKTVKCDSEKECRKVALRTIHNNRIRFSKYGRRKYPDFISFLGSRYCPLNAGNDPQGLNKNWIRNVSFFLKEGL
jgi:hypothetical protein